VPTPDPAGKIEVHTTTTAAEDEEDFILSVDEAEAVMEEYLAFTKSRGEQADPEERMRWLHIVGDYLQQARVLLEEATETTPHETPAVDGGEEEEEDGHFVDNGGNAGYRGGARIGVNPVERGASLLVKGEGEEES